VKIALQTLANEEGPGWYRLASCWSEKTWRRLNILRQAIEGNVPSSPRISLILYKVGSENLSENFVAEIHTRRQRQDERHQRRQPGDQRR
jgi:hypothetical protein